MIKNIFIYWNNDFVNAPLVIKKCLSSWKLHNKKWKIIILNDNNINKYINIEKDIPNIYNKIITRTAFSDIIRIFLLEKYGGCWVDATTFCIKPLDEWLINNIKTGFFAYYLKEDRPLSTWFLYSNKNNYIIKKWKNEVVKYVNKINILGTYNIHNSLNIWKKNKYNYLHYFWFHYLFSDLYNNDIKFKKIWDDTIHIYPNGPRFIQKQGLLKSLSKNVINHIIKKKSPLYKLTYRYDTSKYNKNTNLYYLLNIKY